MEYDLKAAHELFGLNYIIFRPHNVYGERQNMEDKYRNVVTIFMNQLMQNKPVTIFGDGTQTRSFTYVCDVAHAIATSIEKKEAYNQVFNVGSDEKISVKELAELMAKKLGTRPIMHFLKERNEVKHAIADHTKIKQILCYDTTTTLEHGIGRTIDWGKKTGIRKTKEFTAIEIPYGLPDGW